MDANFEEVNIMAKAKALTYEEFMALAKEHYNRGGDSYWECWDEKTFTTWVSEFGQITKTQALRWFREEYDHQKDVAGYWM